jgi:hypothetical protein
MTSPEPVLPETRERVCPSCQSERIVHAGQVIAGGGTIRSEQRCEACGAAFWFVRTRMPGKPPPPWDDGGTKRPVRLGIVTPGGRRVSRVVLAEAWAGAEIGHMLPYP